MSDISQSNKFQHDSHRDDNERHQSDGKPIAKVSAQFVVQKLSVSCRMSNGLVVQPYVSFVFGQNIGKVLAQEVHEKGQSIEGAIELFEKARGNYVRDGGIIRSFFVPNELPFTSPCYDKAAKHLGGLQGITLPTKNDPARRYATHLQDHLKRKLAKEIVGYKTVQEIADAFADRYGRLREVK